jgi:hypothetical protein
MDILRKAYVILLGIALLVLLVLRAPGTGVGWLAVGVTAVSLVGMTCRTTGVGAVAGRFWWGWLGLQLLADAVAYSVETDAIWEATGAGVGWAVAAALGLLMLPLYLSLYQLGRGRVVA